MDGFHDLGGFQGFGPVPHTINSLGYKPVFKEDWEHLAYSLMFVGVDQLKNSASTRYVTQSNASTCASTSARATTSATSSRPQHCSSKPACSRRMNSTARSVRISGSRTRRDPAAARPHPSRRGSRSAIASSFATNTSADIRAPGYVRGKAGVVLHRTTESWPFPDAIGHGDTGAAHQPTYHVEFRVKDLWGDAADDGYVVVDLFEGYLDRASGQSA